MQQYWSKQQLAQFKKQLLQEAERLEEQISSQQSQLQANQRDADFTSRDELSTVDNHNGDHGTQLYEQERAIGFAQHFEKQLSQIKDALERIEHNDYGFCIVCHQPIDQARLAAAPATQYCHKDMALIEQQQAPHKIYEITPLSFVGLNDDDTEFTGYDGEDATQDVLQYGNANIGQHDAEPMDDDDHELHGFVEPIETFIATDITGKHVHIVRNKAYHQYMEQGEGDHELEQYSD